MALSAVDLANMRACQIAHMHDTCTILRYTATSDDYGLQNPLYTPGWTVECGLELVSPDEQQDASFVPAIDAKIRLPLTLADVVDTKDRIKITHRYGEELTTPQVFEIVGILKRGPTGFYLDLKAVTDGTEVGA
jgi:hypothetical protein